ncbi:MAG: TlpA disulfide reductase family protein [Verrucomicrobiota bacterium]
MKSCFRPLLALLLALAIRDCGLGAESQPPVVPVTPSPAAPANPAAQQLPAQEDSAWKQVLESTNPPLPPGEWNQKKPTNEEYAAFRLKMGESAAKAADLAKEFATRFPDSTHVREAKEIRVKMLRAAVGLGVESRSEELAGLGGGTPSREPRSRSAEDPFEKKMNAAAEKAMALQDKGMEVVLAEFEKGIREVMKEFPDRMEVYGALMEVVNGTSPEHAAELAREIRDSKAPENVRQAAAALLKKFDLVGKPLDLKFTAIDGREVSIASLKGSVVLVDFWATWCGPCVGEIPNVKAAYEKLHPKGFEILGISFDQEKDALETFVKKKGMTWPQYFDGEGWQNKFGQEFGINSIPAMWLVDQKGILRDMNARDGLAGKVEKLLAEK